jgi:periplasmic protein TonB
MHARFLHFSAIVSHGYDKTRRARVRHGTVAGLSQDLLVGLIDCLEMFEAFQTVTGGIESRRRLVISTTAAIGVYGVLAIMAFTIGRRVVSPDSDRVVEVAFERVKPKVLPPPPPPKVIPRRPKVALPPVAVAAPPPARPLEPPKEIPKEAPPEASPGTGEPPAPIEEGRSNGVAGGVRGGTGGPAAVAIVPGPAQPVNLPEEATPPVASLDNAPPSYPEGARTAGKEGLVILKIVITAEGRVENIRVLKGEPPFVEAAILAVKSYSFKPALFEGRPIAVYRILKIPFRLSIGG